MLSTNNESEYKYKITTTEQNIQLSQPFRGISSLFPMFNNTYITTSKNDTFDKIFLKHFDESNNLLKLQQLQFTRYMPEVYQTLSQFQIFCGFRKLNKIVQWNVKTYQLTIINFNFDQGCIELFCLLRESKLLCLRQIQTKKEKKYLKMTFFQYPFSTESKPIIEYENLDFELNTNLIQQIDNKSEFVSFSSAQKSFMSLKFYEIAQQDQKWKFIQSSYQTPSIPNLSEQDQTSEFYIRSVSKICNENYLILISFSKLIQKKQRFLILNRKKHTLVEIVQPILQQIPYFSLVNSRLSQFEILSTSSSPDHELLADYNLYFFDKCFINLPFCATYNYKSLFGRPWRILSNQQMYYTKGKFQEETCSIVKFRIERIPPIKLWATTLAQGLFESWDADLLYEICQLITPSECSKTQN